MNALLVGTPPSWQPPGSGRGKLWNLLQVAASALHLVDRDAGDDLRPLTRPGLVAIG